jgi:glycine cleavage system aminomethyltransferase T
MSRRHGGHVFETLWAAGREMGAKLCGMHMMDSCRIEKPSAISAMTSPARITWSMRGSALP